MTTIGHFTQTPDGVFRGAIRTLTLDARKVEIRPVTPAGDKAPDHRVYLGDSELGAAWRLTRKGKPACLMVRLDDPALTGPVRGLLVEVDGGHALRWRRRG